MNTIELLINGAATAIPIILTSVILLFKFKTELCSKTSDLTVKVETHIHIAEQQEKELIKTKDKLTNIILRNNLKY